MYWGQKGEYMVMGVKNQYDKIKKSNAMITQCTKTSARRIRRSAGI